MSEHDHYLGDEYPRSDEIQMGMIAAFLVIWAVDSFWLHLTTMPQLLPLIIRVPLGGLIFLFGGYLMNEAHKLVLDPKVPEFVDYGVFGMARHPMYLGTLFLYLGFAIATLSVASIGLWVIYFVIYDRFAAYEEKELVGILGDTYTNYKKKVRRWGLL